MSVRDWGEAMTRTILVLDDDVDTVETLAMVLEHAGYAARGHSDPIRALTDLDGATLAIVDLSMPRMDGARFIATARLTQPRMKFLLMSGISHEAITTLAERVAVPYLEKPVDVDQLVGVVARLCR